MYSGRLRDPARRATRETPALWAGLRTGPLALTEGLQNCAGAETFGRGSWRGPETPPQRGGDLRSRIVAGSGDPATTGRRPSVADRGGGRGPRHNGAETFGRGSWRGPETPPQRGGDLRSRIVAPERRPSVADRGGVRRPRHNGWVADRGGVRRPRHNESGGHA